MEFLRRALTSKGFVDVYADALFKHLMSRDPNYIACLDGKCGVYFSIEDCSASTTNPSTNTTGKSTTKTRSSTTAKPKRISCPHCTSPLCLTCNRPWHPSQPCSAAAALEDAQSLRTITSLGARPCPACGINIEKNGGCDHMTCHSCWHNFCWQCLVPYTTDMRHADGCRHGRVGVAAEPGNWYVFVLGGLFVGTWLMDVFAQGGG